MNPKPLVGNITQTSYTEDVIDSRNEPRLRQHQHQFLDQLYIQVLTGKPTLRNVEKKMREKMIKMCTDV